MTHQNERWYSELTRYHWFVLIVAALGWLFDCLDQQIFVLARQPALKELIKVDDPAQLKTIIDAYSAYATSLFMIGWATGGLVFGMLGDRIGRARTMLITILLYSVFTGLSAASRSFTDFAFYRFLTGLGVGGEFAVGVALVAEVMPPRARPYALGVLQALSAVGNILAALLNMGMGALVHLHFIDSVWRPLFILGALPALLVVVIRRYLKEPESWQAIARERAAQRQRTTSQESTDNHRQPVQQLGSYSELFGHPVWRRNALVGMGLAFAGVVGLWAVAFFVYDLVGNVLTHHFQAAGLAERDVVSKVTTWKGIASLLFNGGGFLGMYLYARVTQRIGRKPAFAWTFILALLSTVAVYAFLREFWHILVLVPIMGFCTLSLFAGYAIYFPELFPTRLRSTGTSFCYNVGRFVAALGPFVLGKLTDTVYAQTQEPLRYAGLTLSLIFLVGLLILPFAPETKDQPLPE